MPSPNQGPRNTFSNFPASGVLTEYVTPALAGPSGLTDCENLVYHRQGSWGKRSGLLRVNLPSGPYHGTPVSGYRWYKESQTNFVTYAQGALSIGTTIQNLTSLGNFQLSGSTPPCFASARDPQANNGLGANVLIITGLVLPNGSFATGSMTISGLPGIQPNGVYLTVSVTDNMSNTFTTPKYYVLGTDNPSSIAQQLVTLLNNGAAFLNKGSYVPFLGESYSTATSQPYGAVDTNGQPQSGSATPTATIFLGAAHSGANGNSYTYTITLNSGSGGVGSLSVSPTSGSPTNMTGGGSTWSGPAKLDISQFGAGTPVGLSYMAPNAFTQCVSWHDHVWFWGDPVNFDTVFACDILQPEAFTFMIENGGMTGSGNGGYQIGPGDGDFGVQQCVPLGNALYAFKTAGIYMIEGYDFQQGEYQFSITPQVAGYGVPTPYCAAVLENELVFWSGKNFLRLAPGSYEPEHIGLPVPLLEGTVSTGGSQFMRVAAGNIQVQTALTNDYVNDGGPATQNIIYRSMAFFAYDNGTGAQEAAQIAVYDDETTNNLGQYAWAKWLYTVGVGGWIQTGTGPSNGPNVDPPILYFIGSDGNYIYRVGGDATDDFMTPIPWMVQTGYADFQSPDIVKNGQLLTANLQSTSGANLNALIIPGRQILKQAQVNPFPHQPIPVSFNPTLAPHNCEAYNNLEQYISSPQAGTQPLQSPMFLVQFTEDGTSFAQFELISYGIDIRPEEGWGS